MSEASKVAIYLALISASSAIFGALMTYLGTVWQARRKARQEAGENPSTTDLGWYVPPDPAKSRLTAAEADQIIQSVYSRVLDDLQAERVQLKNEVVELRKELAGVKAELEAVRVQADQYKRRVQELEERERSLLTKLATQADEIERLRGLVEPPT